MSASGWKILATGTLSCLFQLRSKKIFCTTVTTLLICKFVNEVRICRVCERPRFLRTVCITPEIQRASGFGTLKKGQVNLKWLREDGKDNARNIQGRPVRQGYPLCLEHCTRNRPSSLPYYQIRTGLHLKLPQKTCSPASGENPTLDLVGSR
ncbi:uncharacterized protein K441DRAFT_199562 [Cenococcum geophilum 1.58]|uniref:uncharacterized protein n=1 Tax=Cenococcum geophilum 1.58 TaxID=794803 RepID=UPI00358F5165|nr:hypothetical protein K441DRAFT_199562 [Cenococcum geophilum 1.58]